MKARDNDWPAVATNLVKTRKSWGRLLWILSLKGADKRVSGNFFKAVVQAVLPFWADTWVLTPRIERALDSFVHGAARRITGKQPRRGGGEQCTYLPLKESMREAGCEGIQKAITMRHNTVAQ